MKKYIQLLRIKNYIKNFLIFLPFVFSGKCLTFDNTYLIMILGFIAFCLSSSFIYIINDLLDRHEDKLHAVKCQRPLASGALSCGQAICVDIVLALSIMIIMLFLHNVWLCLLIGIYIGLNIVYSCKLKNIPIVDISVLCCFFIIRIYFGAFLVDVPVSIYLYLTVMAVAFMMGVIKRKQEKLHNANCRYSLKFYTVDFLSRLSHTFMSLSIVFYSLWIVSDTNAYLNKSVMQLSIFLVVFILMYYQYVVDNSKNGNPVDVLFENKGLLIALLCYALLIIVGFMI